MPGSKPMAVAYVTVRVTNVAADKFVLESDQLDIDEDNHIVFDDKDGFSGFQLFYHLEGAEGYRFPEEPDEALYVNHGTTCPQSKSDWGHFRPKEVTNQGRTLEVHNLNKAHKKKEDREFSYALVAKKTGEKSLLLDPGGTNNNGGEEISDFSVSSNVIVGGIAAAALLAVAFVVLK